jgi:hypothetical protein
MGATAGVPFDCFTCIMLKEHEQYTVASINEMLEKKGAPLFQWSAAKLCWMW